MSTPDPVKTSRLTPYRAALQRLSQRTGASVPALAVSFLILHELTAIVPFGAAFYASRVAGVGEHAAAALLSDDAGADESPSLVRDTARRWAAEGGTMAARVGSRYGIWGYEKRKPGESPPESANVGGRVAGDVANAIVAYAVVKALLPLRIGASLYLSPSFSRWIVEPTRSRVARLFRPRRSS